MEEDSVRAYFQPLSLFVVVFSHMIDKNLAAVKLIESLPHSEYHRSTN